MLKRSTQEFPLQRLAALTAAMVFLGAGCAGNAVAGEPRKGAVALYGARWIESRFPQFPKNLVTGNLGYRDTYLSGVIGSLVVIDDFSVPLPFTDARWQGLDLEAEGTLVKHYGLQHHWEIAAATVVRTPDLEIYHGLAVNGAWGNGLSWAFDEPAFEIGEEGIRGVDTKRLQYHMSLEAEFSFGASPVHLFTRLHHRSGMWGVISPQRTGSNYLGAGLRIDIR